MGGLDPEKKLVLTPCNNSINEKVGLKRLIHAIHVLSRTSSRPFSNSFFKRFLQTSPNSF